MAEITEVIPSITAIPNRLTDTEEEFSTNALTSLTQQATFSDALNVFAEQANDLADEVNTNATIASESAAAAQGASNWVGDWSDGGAGVSGTSYTYDSDFIYLLKVDLADILTSEPSPTNSDWQLINEPEIFAYAVSQLANGVSDDVGYIVVGADATDYTYMIWPDDGRIYSVGGVTGTITAAFDPDDGSDAGLIGDLTNIVAVTPSELDSVEDQLIGVNQVWNSPSRSLGVTYTNNTGRTIAVCLTIAATSSQDSVVLRVNGGDIAMITTTITAYNIGFGFVLVPPEATYGSFISVGNPSIVQWTELS